jgi:copper chaperone NosL
MSRVALSGMLLLAALALAGCSEENIAAIPPPQELTASAIGHYCGMNLLEHPGPKGQIILASRSEPIWFSSARDAFAFTMLPEESKDIHAIYVSDMGRAQSWENPGPTNWVDAKQALYVIASRAKGGMGADETVPFSDKDAAERFMTEKGGRVVKFAEVPRDYVLGTGTSATSTVEQNTAPGHRDHQALPAESRQAQ